MDWKTLLLGEEDMRLLWQIPLRASVIFVAAVIILRLIGQRAVSQRVFEVLIIVIIGSAAGDPLIYEGAGLLPALLAFLMVLILYKVLHFVTGRSKRAERFIEGKHIRLITDGKFEIKNFTENEMDRDAIFSDLRMMNVSQLGQIRAAWIEATGQISIIFAAEDDVRAGLPTFPETMAAAEKQPGAPGDHACTFCGHVQELTGPAPCAVCNHDCWVPASTEKRVS